MDFWSMRTQPASSQWTSHIICMLYVARRHQGQRKKCYKNINKTNLHWHKIRPNKLEECATISSHWRAIVRQASANFSIKNSPLSMPIAPTCNVDIDHNHDFHYRPYASRLGFMSHIRWNARQSSSDPKETPDKYKAQGLKMEKEERWSNLPCYWT